MGFENFAKSKGHKSEDGFVDFDKDEEAARAFNQEAHNAGFKTTMTMGRSEWTDGNEDSSNWPKEWGVKLLSQ